jgi:uncharacterized protein
MKKRWFFLLMAIGLLLQTANADATNQYYPSGRSPLLASAYVKLPFGGVRPQGWLDSQLVVQLNGLTGHLSEIYSKVSLKGLNIRDEFYIQYYEGVVPLAYLMNDATLKKRADSAVSYFINSQDTSTGIFLDSTDTIQGLNNTSVCRFMMEYYDISKDSKVLPFLKRFFHYLNNKGTLTGNSWSRNRSPELAHIAYWLYNQIGDTVILSAVTKICKSKTDEWRSTYNSYTYTDSVNKVTTYPDKVHNVNIGHAFKDALYYLQSKDSTYKYIYTKGLALTDKYHGSVAGRFNADENLTGKQPTRGMELCGIAEMSYSLENLFEAFGDISLADRTEYLVLNCFPGTCTGDMWNHQYDQQSNQVQVNVATRPWNNNGDYSNLYGLYPNYPCCLANMHHTWLRYVEHMWMATQDNGLVAAMYGPCQVNALVGSDTDTVTIKESTEYPFDGTIGFKITVSKSDSFPIKFRIPSWENNASISCGTISASPAAGSIYTISKTWQTGDSVTLTFPMKIRSEAHWNKSRSIMRGPLWYSLKIGESWTKLTSYSSKYPGSVDWQILPTTSWNVALKIDTLHPEGCFTVVRNAITKVPFAQKGEQVFLPGASSFTTWTSDPPVVLKASGRILTSWTYDGTYTSNAADPPSSPVSETASGKDTTIELIPYGCAKLRVTEFPWVKITVGNLPETQDINNVKLTIADVKNGKCRFTVETSGHFDITLFNLAGRSIYHLKDMGPKTVFVDKNILHNGTYIARIVSNGRTLEKKIMIAQ